MSNICAVPLLDPTEPSRLSSSVVARVFRPSRAGRESLPIRLPRAPRLARVDDAPPPLDPRPVTLPLSLEARRILEELARLRGTTPAGVLEYVLRDLWDEEIRSRKPH